MKRFLIITLLTALCCAVTLAASLLGRAGVASASAGDESTGHYIYINFNQDRGQVAVGCNHNSDNSINAGEEVTVVLLPNAGYKVQAAMFGTQTVLSILVNYDENNPLPADGKFIMPDNDVYIRVDFVSETPQQHTVTLQFDSTQGTVSVTGDSNYFYAGETVNLDITPIRGYAADKITSQQDGSSVSVTCSAESFTGVTMPDEDITLTVTFKALQTVTITALGSTGGTVTGGGEYYVGEMVTLTAIPAEDYIFDHWLENDSVMILHPYTFSFRAQSSCTIRAYFKLHKQLTITVEASPAEGGSVSGGGTYYSFDRAPLSASPGDDYEFLYWAVGDNIISYNANYNYIVYENGEVLTAHFVQVGIKYPLWVGNTQVASNRVSGDCWSYSGDGASGTLTLTNANITSAHYYNDDVNLSNICVYAPLKLTINLVGENRIDCNDWEAICGICAMSGNLTITGEGSLNICNKSGQCIYAYELAVRGPTLTAESPNDKSICVNNTLTIENSVVNVTSIETDALVIQNSDVYATTESGLAIYTHQSIAVGGNSLVIAETKSGNRAIEYRRNKSTGEEYFTLGEGLAVTTPENYTTGPYNDSSTGTRMTIKNQDGSNAKRVVIRNINVPALFGSGTSDAPYRIGSADDWKELADFAEAHNTANLYFMQTADITQAVTAQIPAFSGVYDGGGHTLNVSISGGECAAPFHSLSGATVRNLTVTGTVSGSIHCAGLAGCLEGNCALHNVEVAVNVTTGGTHCGGLIGHGGSANTATVENCVFSGTIGGATHAGTLWGWSDGGNISLSGCLDVSACDYPIGLGFGTVHVENTCYTNPNKKAGTSRPWTDRGAMAYSISGEDGITLILTGETGIPRGGVIYAPAGEVISLNALAEPWDGYDLVFSASAGTLTQTDTGLALNMPGEAVVISLLRVPHFSISPAVSLTIDDNSGGYANEGAENLFDGRDDTKWCVRYNGSNWVEFHTEYQVMPSAYAMKTAGDTARYPGRNPTSWRLLGRQSAGDAWTTLAEKTNDTTMPAENCVQRFFPLSVSGRYQYYRFEILAICSESTLQLSEFNLIGSPSFCTPDFTLPANLTTVEAEAFEGIGAGVVFVPDDCESIGDYAFRDCPNLKQIRIPAGCTLGADVFDSCGWVYVYGTAGSPAEVYCQAHENCNFVEEVRN